MDSYARSSEEQASTYPLDFMVSPETVVPATVDAVLSLKIVAIPWMGIQDHADAALSQTVDDFASQVAANELVRPPSSDLLAGIERNGTGVPRGEDDLFHAHGNYLSTNRGTSKRSADSWMSSAILPPM